MHPITKPSPGTEKQANVLRTHALAYPETHEDFPWGHSAFKVRGKAFAFLHADGDGFSLSVKLPDSNALALQLPFAQPTGYGLGKSGWVSARFGRQDRAPLTMLQAWLEESYTAIAPKGLVKQLLMGTDSGRSTAPTPAAPQKRKQVGANTPAREPKKRTPATRKATAPTSRKATAPTSRKTTAPTSRKTTAPTSRKTTAPTSRKASAPVRRKAAKKAPKASGKKATRRGT